MTARTVNGTLDPDQCHWRLPEQCQNRSQWQVEARDRATAKVCHGHLLETCQIWAMAAPLTINPIFLNWDRGIILPPDEV